MNLSDAISELAARGFDYLPAPRMTIMLNDARNSFEDAWEFPWLQAVASGPAPVVLDDLKYVLSVKSDLGDMLWGVDVRQASQGIADLTTPGTPEVWYLADDVGDQTQLHTWPVYDGSVTVLYIRRSPPLQNAGDEPLIPDRYHPIWIDLAVVQAYQDSDNFQGAQALQADINMRMQTVIETYETRNRQHSILTTQHYASEDD